MELVPEFYCLPEFLSNRNNFDLGVTQAGDQVDIDISYSLFALRLPLPSSHASLL